MHRLALGIAGPPGNTYICTPCRLQLAVRRTHRQAIQASVPRTQVSRPFSHSTGCQDDNSSTTGHYEASASQRAEDKKTVEFLPKSMRPVALSVLNIPLRAIAEDVPAESTTKSTKSRARDKKSLRRESDKKAIAMTMEIHKSVTEFIAKLREGPKADWSGRYDQDRKFLRAKIKGLTGRIRTLLHQRYPEGSEYHKPLLGYTESMKKLSDMLLVELNESRELKPKKAKARKSKTESLKGFRFLRLSDTSQDQEPVAQGNEDQEAKTGQNLSHVTGKAEGDSEFRELTSEEGRVLDPEKTFKVPRQTARMHGKDALVGHFEDKHLDEVIRRSFRDEIQRDAIKREIGDGVPISTSGPNISQASKGLSNGPVEPQKDGSASQAASVDLAVGQIDSAASQLSPIDVEQPPVRGLSYGLDRVLFNKGVYQLQDLRSRVYNFDPYLTELIPVEEFNFDLLQGFITSSKDTRLLTIAKENDKRYTGSSSSMTSVLSHFHFLLSRYRPINLQQVSGSFPLSDHHHHFTKIATAPAAIFLRLKDGVYAIDSDKEFGSTNVLSLLGNSLEKLLTLDKKDYLKYRKDSTEKIPEEMLNAPETYHYTGLGEMLMRSQLDAHDPRLPGTGMFDLKTRATWPIRMNVDNYQEGRDYEIRHHFGLSRSYEREYVDMLRATMMKYMLQVRIGRMDGIFVAFHNTRRIFGFQYLPLEEIDLAIHGQADRSLGDQEFKLSVKLMNEVLNKATEKFPNTSIRLLFNTIGGARSTKMLIFAQPVTEDEANEIQHKNDRDMAAITEEIMAGKFPEYDEEGMRVVDYSVLDQQSEASARRYGVAENDSEQVSELTDETEDGLDAVAPVEALDADVPADLSAVSTPEPSTQDPGNPDEAAAAAEQVLNTDINAPIESPDDEATEPDHVFDGDESFIDRASEDLAKAAKHAASGAPLLAMELFVENFVNGTATKVVGFPAKYNRTDAEDNMARQAEVSSAFAGSKGAEWTINYQLKEFTDPVHSWQLFLKTQGARHNLLYRDGSKDVPGLEKIRNQGIDQSKEGRNWRAQRDEQDQGRPKVVVGDV